MHLTQGTLFSWLNARTVCSPLKKMHSRYTQKQHQIETVGVILALSFDYCACTKQKHQEGK